MFRKLVDWRHQWLRQMFEHSLCEECGRGAEGHEAVNVNGLPFARCREMGRSKAEAEERAWREGR